MNFEKLSAPSLKDLFVSQIRSSILSGDLPVGSKLPPEREIASRMQVSRAVINSGFEILERQGFLEVRPRLGVYVADYAKYGNIETLVSIMEYSGENIKASEIRSILEFRRALEHLATGEFVAHASDAEITRFREYAEGILSAPASQEAVESVFSFHHEMAAAGGNTILPLIYISFKPVITKLWQKYCHLYGRQLLYENTMELYRALERRNISEASACTDRNLDDTISGKHRIC